MPRVVAGFVLLCALAAPPEVESKPTFRSKSSPAVWHRPRVRAAGGCRSGSEFWTVLWTGAQCVTCTSCVGDGSYTASPCSETRDTVCGVCQGSTFSTGTQCVACTNCGVGRYTAWPCSKTQDTVCAPCQGKPAHAKWTGSSSNTSCTTWLCDAGFFENRSGECLRCAQCPAGFSPPACGYDEREAVLSRSDVSQDGSSCYATCSERNLFFTGVWSAQPMACECASKRPRVNQTQEEGACLELSKPLATTCATGQRAVASFAKHTGLLLVQARAVPLPSASQRLFAEIDKDRDGGVSLVEMTQHRQLCCAGHALAWALNMFRKSGVGPDASLNLASVGSAGITFDSAAAICLAMCQADASCSCTSAFSVHSNGSVLGPGCFFASHPCETNTSLVVRAALPQPSPSLADGAVFSKTAAACLACPPGGSLNANGTCVCGSDAILSFAKTPKCAGASPGVLKSLPAVQVPVGTSMEQAKEHCAAAALGQAAPVFCVNGASLQCSLYFPGQLGDACGPAGDGASLSCSGKCPCMPSFGLSGGTFSYGPEDYNGDRTCSWTIASPGANISVRFISFDTANREYLYSASQKDFVRIYSCTSADCITKDQVAQLSGYAAVSAETVFSSSTGFLMVAFDPNSDYRGSGFEAVWSVDQLQCFVPKLACLPLPAYTCAAPLRIEKSDKSGRGAWLDSDNTLDNGGWEWMALGNLTHNCSTRCLEGHFLSSREDPEETYYYTVVGLYSVRSKRHKCVDRRIRDAWLATYALLWIFVVGATAFFAWRFYVRPDNRCACGVGWVYRCAEHRDCVAEAATLSAREPVRGLVWKCIGAEKPATGTEISNAALAAALQAAEQRLRQLRANEMHQGTRCDGCGQGPIRGPRWKCERCADFDLCDVCHIQFRDTGQHHTHGHDFNRIDKLQIADSNIVKLTAEEFAACGVTSLEMFEASALTFISVNDKYFVPLRDIQRQLMSARCLAASSLICDSNGCKCDSGLVCDAPDWRPATRRWGALLIGVQALAMATSAVLWQWDRLFLGGFELFFWVQKDRTHDWDDTFRTWTEPWDIPGRVNSADATITVSVLSWVMLTAVVPWVICYHCVVVAQSLVVLGWFAMNVVIVVSPAFLQPAIAFFVCSGLGVVFTWVGCCINCTNNTERWWPLHWRTLHSHPHKTPYRLHCCRCARRAAEDWCGLCRMREAGDTCSTDSAQEAAAVVRYSTQPGELRHEPPPETRLTSVETPAHWGRLRFPVSFGRAWKRNDKARTIASLAFSEVTGSAGCKSGEVAYWEVEVVRMGGCLRVGWRRKTNFGGRGLQECLDCSEPQHALLSMRHFSTSAFSTLSAGDRVCIQWSGRRTGVLEFVRATENRDAHVKLDGCGEEIFFRSELYQVVTETLLDMSVSEGDVIGLACDLDQGKLSWSLNGDWGTSVSIDLDKNERGKFDTMWPFISLEAHNAFRVRPSPALYPDGSNLRLLRGRPGEWLPVRAEGPQAPLHYAVTSTGAPLPPGLALDPATGKISGTFQLDASETGDRCCQIHVEVTDPWRRKQSHKVRLHLYLAECEPELLSYSSAYTIFFPPPDAKRAEPEKLLVSDLTDGESLSVQVGVEIHIPADFFPGFPIDTWFHCQEELPPGLWLHPESFGLLWRQIGSEKPETGISISNAKLAKALQEKLKFTREEFDAFQVSALTCSSYVQVGDEYYRPAAEKGDISGVPMTAGDFELKVEASNSAGSAERVLKLTVHAADVPFGLSYPAHRPDGVFYPGHQYEIGEPVRIEPDSLPRCSNHPETFRYIISPPLPAGLDIDSETGVIHGDATEELETTRFIVTAFPLRSIRPPLPAGLDIDSATGVIHGDATEELETTRFVVTALYMGAHCCAIIRIKVAAACGPHDEPEWQIPTDLANFRGATITAGRRYETNEGLLKTQLRPSKPAPKCPTAQHVMVISRISSIRFRCNDCHTIQSGKRWFCSICEDRRGRGEFVSCVDVCFECAAKNWKRVVCAKFSSEPSLPKGLAIDENGQILGIPLELSIRKIFKITAEHRNFRRSVDIVFEIREPQEGLAIRALGLEWSELGSERPTTGTEIRNETLFQALESKLKWTQADFGGDSEKFNAFMVPNLTCNDFIKVGDKYYAPADACNYSEPIHVPRPERSPASIENMEQPGGGSVGTDSMSKASTEAQRSQHSRASAGQASRPDGERVPEIKGVVFEKKLGAGGQGTVWLATHQCIQRAIKICQSMDDKMRNREVQNLHALTVLQHPNVVRFIDYLDEHHALVMEYIDGRSLKTHLHESHGKLKWEEACIIMRGILSGLECLHCSTPGNPMLHRDVTPANVMLRESPVQHTDQVVLVDLGLSKTQEKGQTITVGEKFIGTPEYLSPEIVKGLDPKAFDTRVDVWAAGVILYEMLAGKRPFTGDNTLHIFERIKNDRPNSIPTAGSGVNAFIYRALEKEREKRFTDASDMLKVFEEVCKNRHNIPEQLMQPQKPSPLDKPKGKPRIAAFFAKKRADVDDMLEQVRGWARDESIEKAEMSKEVAALIQQGVERLDLHGEAETLMLGFQHPCSLFEVDVHAQPTYQSFLDCMLSAREKNVRVLHLAGHSTAPCGFVWVTKHPSTDYHEVSMEEFAKIFETEAAGRAGTVECVVLNACESEEMAKRLRKYGVPHVICWRSKVRDVTAMRFSETFYKALDCQGDNSRDYKRAFEQAAQPARMRSSESPGAERKPAKYAVRGAVDFICLLSKDGDVFPEPPKEAPSSAEAKEIGDVSADAGPKKLECESSTLSLDCVSLENALDDEEVIGDEEEPTRNWRPPRDDNDYAALAGKHERAALTALGFEMKLQGKDIAVGHGIQLNGFLETDVFAKWGVRNYPEMWGSSGKAVEKAREAKTQRQISQLQTCVLELEQALVQRRKDMDKHTARRRCGGACPINLKCSVCTPLYLSGRGRKRRNCLDCKRLNCTDCVARQQHEHMESRLYECKEAIKNFL